MLLILYPDPGSVISNSVTAPLATTTLAVAPFQTAVDGADAVSYTHLTLPTTSSV